MPAARKVKEEDVARMVAFRLRGASLQEIADIFGVSKVIVRNRLREQGLSDPAEFALTGGSWVSRGGISRWVPDEKKKVSA